ncbi:fasciclin domain-containing protein [Marixanthomonas spongiae]|uniref:Fasciclin n=1 Tax=Marixanthomonas spongiae TaxID=2174845 RepID=A0A2U0HX02_9FLAO|nr:fasciclin domain-containing protein [Marixanthomonas spongiae]PVW13401.1 fasciclin [Marixanthomonas spongiae]
MKKLVNASLIVMLYIFTLSCSDDDDSPIVDDEQTTAEYVANNPEYSSLATAMEKTGLTATLNGNAELTLFAPDNEAFAAFLSDNVFNSLDDVPEDLLKQTLLNHVVVGDNEADDLTTGYINSEATFSDTDAKLSMYVDTSTGVMLNGVSTVTKADIDTANGVVHAVDAVIALPTVVTFVTADSNFGSLANALTLQGQPDFVSVLSTNLGTDPTPFTVFAPNDKAFSELFIELGITTLNEIDSATLTAALNTHVVAGENYREDNLPEGAVSTLGAEIDINATNNTITDPNGRISSIITTDVQASNGVVHVINKVLLP